MEENPEYNGTNPYDDDYIDDDYTGASRIRMNEWASLGAYRVEGVFQTKSIISSQDDGECMQMMCVSLCRNM